MVHSCRAVQSGASACSHGSGWLLQLEQQLPHSHDFSIHTGRQNITETHTCCQVITSPKLLTLVFFFFTLFLRLCWILTCSSCLLCCFSASLFTFIFGSPRPRAKALRRLPESSTRTGKSRHTPPEMVLNCSSSKHRQMRETTRALWCGLFVCMCEGVFHCQYFKRQAIYVRFVHVIL